MRVASRTKAPTKTRGCPVAIQQGIAQPGNPYPSRGDDKMRMSQLGDQVRIHYVQRFANGTVRSSRERGDAPLDLTVGTENPKLPGVGAGLVGLSIGNTVTISVPAERAYGLTNPARVHRVARTRFGDDQVIAAGRRAKMQTRPGCIRLVRVVEDRGRVVVIDTNHPRSGQAVEVEVELITIVN